MYGRRLTAQQKDERQDNGDKKRLARQHPSDLLHSLTHEQDRQRTAQRCLNSTSSFAILFDRTSHMLRVRHMMHMSYVGTSSWVTARQVSHSLLLHNAPFQHSRQRYFKPSSDFFDPQSSLLSVLQSQICTHNGESLFA